MWRRLGELARRPWVSIPVALYGLYLLFGFFLVDPLAQRVLPWAGERMLASRLAAERVAFNPFTLELEVRGLSLAEPAGAPLAGFDRLYANLDVAGIARWAWRIRSVDLEGPRARVEVRQGGGTNWSALVARVRERMGPPSDSMARVLVDHVRIADGDIAYVDGNRPGEPFKAAFHPLGITLEAISTLPEDRGDYLLSARLPEQGATLRWKGVVALNPLVSQGEVSLDGARVGRLIRAVDSRLAVQPAGTLGATLRYRFAIQRTPAKEDVAAFTVSDAQVVVRDFALAARDGAEPLLQVAEARVGDAAFDLARREISIGSVTLAQGKVAATRDARGALDWQALFTPEPAPAAAASPSGDGGEAPWKLAVRDIRLAGWSFRWTDQGYTQPLAAAGEALELSASLAGEFGGATRLQLGPLQAAVGPVQVTSGTEPVARLQRAALTNVQVQLPENRIRAEALALNGARAAVALDKEQRLNWLQILARGSDPPAAAGEATPLPDLRLAKLTADDIEVQFTDASAPTPVKLDLVQGRIALADVGLDMARAIPLEAAFSVQQGGRFEARGSIVPAAPEGKLDVRLAGLSLKPFAPYVNQQARLHLDTGAASTRGTLAFAPGRSGTSVAFSGGFAVDNLAITEEDTGEAFLGWKKLSSESTTVTLAPDRAHIRELVALDPFGKVIIFPDQTVNLQRVRRTPAAVPVAATAAPQPTAMFPLSVERLRIVGANAEFADLSLTPQFGTRMHDLGGVIVGLSTDPASSAQVELDGKVDEAGSARVRGSIQPFRATESTDLALSFRNLEMTRLTPYSGKFAGRRIESGRLSVDLEYKIKQRQLAGTNKFVVTRLKLGENVDSPDAMKLPLDLAIAVLEDSNGVIDLDLPVSGSLDDPQFSYGSIVWKAVVNVLTKIVTAPFRALGALLGVEGDKMQAVAFDPGRSALLPPEQEKLKVVADALAKKPSLTLTIEPGYDTAADRRALQDAAMRREAAAVAGVKLAAGEDPGPVDVGNYKVQTWLEDRYAKEVGKDDYEKLRAGYKDKDAGAATRVMETEFMERLGRRLSTREGGPPSAFHAELLDRLARRVPVGDDALVALAQERAKAMREAMVKHGLAEERVAVGAPAAHPVKEKMVESALVLGAGGRSKPAPQALLTR